MVLNMSPTRRVIEPFVYFPSHASAIPGLGGSGRSPDPNYCFHTHYFDYQPGTVLIHITLLKATATVGELSVRIHGYRPEHPHIGIKLITSDRHDLSGLQDMDRAFAISFPSIPGVHYAAYGYFSEPSDLRAEGIEMSAEELGGDTVANYQEGMSPPSMLPIADLASANILIGEQSADLKFVTSQACTSAQLASTEFQELWPTVGCSTADPFERWRVIHALQTLATYGLLQPGSGGIAIGKCPRELEGALVEYGARLFCMETEAVRIGSLSPKLGYFDFALCLNASSLAKTLGGAGTFVDQVLQRVMSGGFAIFSFDFFQPKPGAHSDVAPAGTLTKNDLEKIALRLIGHGCDVAQLKFPSTTDQVSSASTPFNLVVRR